MRRIIGAATGLWAVCAVAAFAPGTDNPVVVEPFTSQGCSSCPPADAILGDLAARDDVIALALHVDYWDYIGWADTFADPAYTKRQRAYARVAGARNIYTPQMVVGGMDHLVGVRPMELSDLIDRHNAKDSTIDLDLARSGDSLRIAATASAPLRAGAVVQLVRYRPKATVAIERGENAGREISYVNIVESITSLGEWDGSAPLAMQESVSGDDAVVVIVQEPGMGPILAAARLR
jgi:hypothetical protein